MVKNITFISEAKHIGKDLENTATKVSLQEQAFFFLSNELIATVPMVTFIRWTFKNQIKCSLTSSGNIASKLLLSL